MRPRLERAHEVLAPTLPGHYGGPPLPAEITATTMAEAVEAAMDEAGLETAHIVGNSLGGHVALQLAARARARSVVALAPAGGWVDASPKQVTLDWFKDTHAILQQIGCHAAFIASTPEGRRQATAALVERSEHLSAETVQQIITAAANCPETLRMIEAGERESWAVGEITCPVRIVWGTEDKLLPWPRAAERYRAELPYADWVELDGVGHCPQLEIPLECAELILGFA